MSPGFTQPTEETNEFSTCSPPTVARDTTPSASAGVSAAALGGAAELAVGIGTSGTTRPAARAAVTISVRSRG